jgi:pilus assembly protein TadC
MDISFTLIFVSLTAGAVVFALILVLSGGRLARSRPQKALKAAEKAAPRPGNEQTPFLDPSELSGLARQLAEAGLSLSVSRFYWISAGLGLAGLALGWIFFIPGLPSLLLGAAFAYAPTLYIRDRIATRALRLDEDLPVTLARISVGLETQTTLETVFEDAARHLQPGRPLAAELFRTAQELRTEGPSSAFAKLAARSQSVSLSNAAMLLQSLSRAGSSQLAQAVSSSAVDIQRMIEVRNQARTKAAQAMQAAVLLPLIMLFILITMTADPAVSASFREPLVQVVIAAAMLAMGAGYLFMRDQVRRVV